MAETGVRWVENRGQWRWWVTAEGQLREGWADTKYAANEAMIHAFDPPPESKEVGPRSPYGS